MSGLLDELRGDRERTASGHLTLDREKAREKLRKFRLPDPHYYVLQFVRAASALGASKVEFQVTATQMHCRFDAVVPPDVMDDLWTFDWRREAAQQAANYLALGIGSAQALRPKHIVVRSGARELIVMDESERTRVLSRQHDTTITLSEKFRFGHLLEFLTSNDELREARAIHERCGRSHLQVLVNGTFVSNGPRRGDRLFRAPVAGGEAMFFIDPTLPQTELHLLKHGVAIGTLSFARHGIPGQGTVESSALPTDLSGLSVIGDHDTTRQVTRQALGAYHHAVQSWLETRSERPDDVVSALLDISEYLLESRGDKLSRDDREELPGGTRSLLQWLTEEHAFPRADGDGGAVSVRDVMSPTDGTIGFSRQTFVGLDPKEPPVILVRKPQHPDDQTMHALQAIAKVLDVPLVDRTAALVRQERRDINVRRWRSRSVRQPSTWQAQLEFTVTGMTVVIYLPVDAKGALHPEERGLKLFLDGRLVKHSDDAKSLPIGVVIDGPLTLNFAHDEVVHDARFIEIASEILRRSPEVFDTFARRIGDQPNPHLLGTRLLDDWVCALAQGTAAFHLLSLLGLEPAQVQSPMESMQPMALAYDDGSQGLRARSVYGVAAIAGSDPAQVVELLGPLATIPALTLHSASGASSGVTLAEVISDQDRFMKIAAAGDYREFLQAVDETVEERPLVVSVTPEQFEMLDAIAPAVADARQALSRDVKRQLFLTRPKYDVRTDRTVEYRTSFETEEGTITVELNGWPEPGCQLVVLHERRLLRRVMLDQGPGSFQVVVESEVLDPGLDDGLLEQTRAYQRLIDTVTRVIKTTRTAWWNKVRREGPPASGGMRSLYFEVAASVAAAGERTIEPMLPAVRWDGSTWERRLISIAELRESVHAGGGLLPFCRTQTPDRALLPVPEGWVISLGCGVSDALLRQLVPTSRLGEVSISATARPSEARRRFQRRDHAPFVVPGTGLLHRTSDEHFEAILRLVPDPTMGKGDARVRATVLHDDRKLEALEIKLPMGRFRAVVRGPGIGPAPSFDYVNRGRAELFAFLRSGAADTIRAACRGFEGLHFGEHDAQLMGLRRDVLRMMALEEASPPFDFQESFARTRIFRTTAGEWLTRDDVGRLARGGWVPFDDSGTRTDVLRVEADEFDLHGTLLPWQLRPAGEMNLPSEERMTARDGMHHADPLLDAVARRLVAARGERFDAFDDTLVRTFHWSAEPDVLCHVTPDGIGMRRDHPMVVRVRERMDDTSIAFLASVVFSSVNRSLTEVIDAQELEMQQHLLRSGRVSE